MSKLLCVILFVFLPINVLAQEANTTSNAAAVSAPQDKNNVGVTVEAVDKYLGGIVGEIFAPEPAPRVIARYGRTTKAGTFYVSSWNSVGAGFNQEADLGLGYSRGGFDFSYTHFFVRGGDIETFEASKSGQVNLGGVTVAPFARVHYFTGTGKGSPTGGVVTRVGASYGHKLSRVAVSHSLSLGLDNNPFGLGEGLAGLVFYTGQVEFRNYYVAWTAARPFAGNTTRGFRQGVATGYRHEFKW